MFLGGGGGGVSEYADGEYWRDKGGWEWMTRSGCLGLSDLELPAPLSWPGLLLGPTPLLSKLDFLINLLLLHKPTKNNKYIILLQNV